MTGNMSARGASTSPADCQVDAQEESFGNLTHAFTSAWRDRFRRLNVLSRAKSIPTTCMASCGARSSVPAEHCFCAKRRSTAPDPGHRRLRRRGQSVGEGRRRPLSLLHALLDRRFTRNRPSTSIRPMRRRPRRGILRDEARGLPGSHPHVHRRARSSAFRRAMSAAISTALTASCSRRRAMPGRRPLSTGLAGSVSTPPTRFPRPTRICGSRSGSIT